VRPVFFVGRARPLSFEAAFTAYNGSKEKVVRIFDSLAEADEAEAVSEAQLSPDERIRITLELRNLRHPDAAQQGFARVSRVVELERS
jgi:hypothetical protein